MERLKKIIDDWRWNILERDLVFKLAAICMLIYFVFYVTAKAEENYDITAAVVIVNWYESEAELIAAEGEGAGFAQCEYRPEFNISFCEFWLVRPTPDNDAKYVCNESDAYHFDSIGHEFYHAFVGDFHE